MDISVWLKAQPVVAQAILGVAAFNILLSGVHQALSMIKDKTKTDLDNKADDAVSKVLGLFQKVLDFVGYNPEHK